MELTGEIGGDASRVRVLAVANIRELLKSRADHEELLLGEFNGVFRRFP